ncbi:hypothetical protein [Nocardia jiangxiensis]|uniref:hypothetical protein n=1 Tax=Nocardia jiangxiensis TaxID=282685 RepID=UPI0002E8B8D0|nr:hypothetical protein [Nocardia jiangxiensis]
MTTLDDLLTAVANLVTAGTFAMAPGALGSDGIRVLVTDSFPLADGKWVLTAVQGPTRQNDAVVLTGTSATLLGVSAPRLALSFDLADAGAPALRVVLTPDPDSWNPGVSFPDWRETAPALTELVLERPRLVWSSLTRPEAAAGLNVAADDVSTKGSLAALAVFPDLRLPQPRGAITGGTPPTTRIVTEPSPALTIGGLSLPLTFTAVAAAEPGPCLEFGSAVHIGHGVPDIAVSARTSDLSGYLILDADLTTASSYALSAFADFLHDAPVADLVRDVLTVPETILLTHLSAVIGLDPARLASVAVTVGTGRSLDVIPGQVSIPSVSATFTVEDPVGRRTISALLAGTFRFLDEYDLEISAYYTKSSIRFDGALDPDTSIQLSRIIEKYVPSATWLPELTLNRLEVSADLRDKQYSFGLAIASDWPIPLGPATFHLTGGSLDLDYQADTGFDGTVTATAALTGRSGEQVASFDASLAVRSTGFELKGVVPEVSLTGLAGAFSGSDVLASSGLPAITLKNSSVLVHHGQDAARELRVTKSASYEFAAATEVSDATLGSVQLFLAARRPGSSALMAAYRNERMAAADTDQAGFVVGIVVAPNWNPGTIWGDIGGVFDYLVIRDAGILVSTDKWAGPFPDLKLPRLPETINPGVTFIGSLLLTDKALSVLSHVLPADVELDLSADINTKKLLDSSIQGILPHPARFHSVDFTKLVVTLTTTRFSVEADVTFTVQDEKVPLVGRGVIGLALPPTLTLSVSIEHWVAPFGISGLTIDEFGLDIGVEDTGLSVGLLGKFLIGAGPDAFALTIGGELTDLYEPSAFVFGLDPTSGHELTLAAIVGQFTGTDLHSVPLLDSIAITRLDCYVVADPNGWTAPNGHLYPKGFGLDADVRFFEWTLEIKAVLGDKGIAAAGSIEPAIVFGKLFALSDATGKTGPHVAIDTTALGKPGTTYFDASGQVELLGLVETFTGHASNDGFAFSFHTDLKLFTTDVSAALSKSGFTGEFEGDYDFDLTLQSDVEVDGITVLPKGFRIHGPRASLDVGCAVSMSAASLHANLDFTWCGVHFNPAMKLTVTADIFTDLGKAILLWISDNAATFFADILDDVKVWLSLLMQGVLWIGQTAVELVRVLFKHFAQSVAQVADAMLDLDKFDIPTLASALVEVCGITMNEALKLLEKNCAITKAANAL